MVTIPDVFIIESLDPDDEGNGRFEGSVISNMLRFHGKSPKRYVRTRDEFEKSLKEFGESNYRYLHVSAHGDQEGMVTTNLEEIDFDELSDLLKPFLNNKRLFLSACAMVHEDFAAHLIPNTGCFSVIGPEDDIHFHKAAIFWASVYHLMFSKDSKGFNRPHLKEMLRKASKLLEVNVRYFSKAPNLKQGFREDVLHPNRKIATP
ncbi:hypothetical protein [Mesorhizobium sp.]|uniref:hypothetical protein n=1 Tax=Mesorhizobium sp. TaxID=1871066 RepID=UPI00121833D7|nr:hypothetical protein [Mesorhizobium sp.]TIL44952.1 MAG: hypothetical protein E5Y86_13750 [Mesorhizobium sp.]